MVKRYEHTMPKKKTSINIDADLWKKWTIYVIQRYGSSRKVSDALAEAISDTMTRHPIEQ